MREEREYRKEGGKKERKGIMEGRKDRGKRKEGKEERKVSYRHW